MRSVSPLWVSVLATWQCTPTKMDKMFQWLHVATMGRSNSCDASLEANSCLHTSADTDSQLCETKILLCHQCIFEFNANFIFGSLPKCTQSLCVASPFELVIVCCWDIWKPHCGMFFVNVFKHNFNLLNGTILLNKNQKSILIMGTD